MNDTVVEARSAHGLKMVDTLGLRDGVTWLVAESAATPAQAMARLRPWPGMVLPIVAADAEPAGTALSGWARACAGKARYVLLFGKHAPRYAEALGQVGGGVIIVRCADTTDAVQAAARLAHVGDAVVWTPLGTGGGPDDAAYRAAATGWVLASRTDAWVAA
ncbi:MAG: hypothetical protein ABI780_09085 [Ardenticatenales bacterium]